MKVATSYIFFYLSIFAIQIAIGMVSTNAMAAGNNCVESINLSRQQCAVVKMAKRNHLPLVVLNFEINEEIKTIVVLGEAHIKTSNIAIVESRLLDVFNFRLLEAESGNGDDSYHLGDRMLQRTSADKNKYRKARREVSDNLLIESAINRARSSGFLFTMGMGEVFFNLFPLGQMHLSHFYQNVDLKFYLERLEHMQIGNFYKTLYNWVDIVGELEKAVSRGQKVSFRPFRSKSARPLRQFRPVFDIPKLSVVNIFIEHGKESQWQNYCQGILCVFDASFFQEKSFVISSARKGQRPESGGNLI